MRSIPTTIPQTGEPVVDLTTVEAVNIELGISGDTAADAITAAQITSASKLIATFCNTTFALTTISHSFRVGYWERVDRLILARSPIRELTSVTVDDVLLDNIYYEVDEESGLLNRIHGLWHGHIVALFTMNYDLPDEAPEALARACIDLIKAQRFNAGRDPTIRSVTSGEHSVSYQTSGAGGSFELITPGIAELIKPYKVYSVA